LLAREISLTGKKAGLGWVNQQNGQLLMQPPFRVNASEEHIVCGLVDASPRWQESHRSCSATGKRHGYYPDRSHGFMPAGETYAKLQGFPARASKRASYPLNLRGSREQPFSGDSFGRSPRLRTFFSLSSGTWALLASFSQPAIYDHHWVAASRREESAIYQAHVLNHSVIPG
jgi:hypothetical protein